MLKCREIPELCSAWLDGQLTLRERISGRLHLFICHRCRHYWRALFRVAGAMPHQAESASDEQVEAVLAKIEEHSM